ncbi:MAG TPA: aminoacyl-tRNA hydrolase [Actinomycetota bacterium]
MRVVVGLGNPGPAYEATRHNLGARAVRVLADRQRTPLEPDPIGALVGRVAAPPDELRLAIPQTGMNDCGPVVRALYEREGLAEPRRLLVVHDELDLPVGRLKVKAGGGTAGHNGLQSIVDALGTADFVRVRIGVGKPPSSGAGVEYVLGRPEPEDLERLDAMAGLAADAVELVVAEGVGTAMTRFNRRSD